MRALTAAAVVLAAVGTAAAARRCADHSPLKNVYFGELHNHTAYSLDAYGFGTRTEPAASYAFARGAAVDVGAGYDAGANEVPGPFGYTINFSGGHLDFASVTDHSEWLATDYGCTVDTGSPFYDSSYCTNIRNQVSRQTSGALPCFGGTDGTRTGCTAEQTTAWGAERQATEAANDPCHFTTFHAYEWTYVNPIAGDKETLHKNVFFRNASVPSMPIDAANYPTGPRLWAALTQQCNGTTGCEALTIPHNMNQSNGQAFNIDGYSAIDLNRMLEFQRLVEIHQHKGNSECVTDTADTGAVAACDFEVVSIYAQPQDTPGYVRPAMEAGLVRRAQRGYDPTQVGFVGATDNHDGTPGAVAENGYVGHIGSMDNRPALRLAGGRQRNNPGGVTGIWAEENTREALWAALKRRETFATSGPRLAVRFYEYTGPLDPCADPTFPAAVVNAGGVPMGGTMRDAGTAPSFVVYALQDQTPLAAVDIVKASAAGGAADEKVHRIPLTGTPACVTWTDPDFDASEPAFYYARVLEQPTWRWSHYDCQALMTSNPARWQTIAPGCAPGGRLDVMIQERAWTSSIWYLPGGPVTVQATALRMRDGTAKRVSFIASTRHDPSDHRIALPPPGTVGDPTPGGASGGGATLVVYNPVTTGEQVTLPLPATGWSANRTRTRYLFKDPAGPVQRVSVMADRLRLRGGGAAWPFTLDEPRQGSIAVRLALGASPAWCGEAPARTSGSPPATGRNDVPRRFTGQPRSPYPDQCPVLGSPCGAFLD